MFLEPTSRPMVRIIAIRLLEPQSSQRDEPSCHSDENGRPIGLTTRQDDEFSSVGLASGLHCLGKAAGGSTGSVVLSLSGRRRTAPTLFPYTTLFPPRPPVP